MSSELIDETKYLTNRNEFIRLLEHVYKDTNLKEVVETYSLILVGGQALAIWHFHYLHGKEGARDFHYAFSDDIDFFGLKICIQFLEQKLNSRAKVPENFDPTINLGLFKIRTEVFPDGLIVDLINSVGGLSAKEIKEGVEVLSVDDFNFPLINPYLCLKSRIHNYFATYKADKDKEINRVEISLRVCREYLNDMLDVGWDKKSSSVIEGIIKIALSINGCDLFIKNNIDLLDCIDINHKNMNKKFFELRFPRVVAQIDTERQKRSRNLNRHGGLNSKNHKPYVPQRLGVPLISIQKIVTSSHNALKIGSFSSSAEKAQKKNDKPGISPGPNE